MEKGALTKSSSSVSLKNIPQISPPVQRRKKDTIEKLRRLKHANLDVKRFTGMGISTSQHSLKFGEEIPLQRVLSVTLSTDFRNVRKRLILSIALQVSLALKYLHEHKFYHGNVTPDNIMLKSCVLVRLYEIKKVNITLVACNTTTSDTSMRFKYAPRAGNLLSFSDIRYTSPESIISSNSFPSIGHDMWMYGATLFHMCCGMVPIDYEAAFFLKDRKDEEYGVLYEARTPSFAYMTMPEFITETLKENFAHNCSRKGGLLSKHLFFRTICKNLLSLAPKDRNSSGDMVAIIRNEVDLLINKTLSQRSLEPSRK
jgi:serine/threonine protein kinase